MFSESLSGLGPNSGFSSVVDDKVAKDIIIKVTGNDDSRCGVKSSSEFKKAINSRVVSLIVPSSNDMIIISLLVIIFSSPIKFLK